MQLSTWDKEELDDKLANRVQVSKRAVAKIVQVFDRLMQRNEKITMALKGETEDGEPAMDETLRQTHLEIMAENKNLQMQNTALHEKFHTINLKMSELQDTLTGKETEAAELRNQIDDLQYELEKVRCRNDKLENHLAEAIEKLKAMHQMHGDDKEKEEKSSKSGSSSSGGSSSGSKSSSNMTSVAAQHLEDLQKELEEHRELANNRLQELDRLHSIHRDVLKEVEKLKMELSQLPESVIVETTEYKCLQSQFSVLYNESMQIKTLLDETRNQLQTSKNTHLRQIEMMESEELMAQKRVRSEMIQMEDVLAQIRKEYEMLRIEFEQNMAANEQTAPINREMRHLITSLQNHNVQLKGEVHRYKRKYKEVSADNVKMRKELDDNIAKLNELQQKMAAEAEIKKEEKETIIKEEGSSSEESSTTKEEPGTNIKSEGEDNDEEKEIKKEQTGDVKVEGQEVKKEVDQKELQRLKEAKAAESEMVRDLKTQLKKAVNEQKEMKLLLDMYKGVSKEQRDKVQLMATEKKLRGEIEELRKELKKIQDSKREDRKKLADEDALRKIKQLEEKIYELQKQLANKPQDGNWSGGYRPFVGSHVS